MLIPHRMDYQKFNDLHSKTSDYGPLSNDNQSISALIQLYGKKCLQSKFNDMSSV